MTYKGWSSNCTIELQIERIIQDGQLRLPTLDDPEENILVILIEIEGFAAFSPGRYDCRPESCYPNDSECEIISYNVSEDDTYCGKVVKLTDREEKEALTKIYKQAKENGDDNFSSPYEYEADCYF